MNNIPKDLDTLLAGLQLQQHLQYPIQIAQVNVEDKSNRLEWLVQVVYQNRMQRFNVWMNPNGEWGWDESNMMNFGF